LGTNSTQHILRHLAVTAAFAAGSIVITAGIWLIFSTDTRYVDPLTGFEWLNVGLATFTLALLSGLVVDAIRLVGCLEWPKEGLPRLPNRETLGSELL
jgi:hypothetical protein